MVAAVLLYSTGASTTRAARPRESVVESIY